MAVYDWRDFERLAEHGRLQALAQRYESAAGATRVDAWQAFITELLELLPIARDGGGHAAIDAAVDRFRERVSTTPQPVPVNFIGQALRSLDTRFERPDP